MKSKLMAMNLALIGLMVISGLIGMNYGVLWGILFFLASTTVFLYLLYRVNAQLRLMVDTAAWAAVPLIRKTYLYRVQCEKKGRWWAVYAFAPLISLFILLMIPLVAGYGIYKGLMVLGKKAGGWFGWC